MSRELLKSRKSTVSIMKIFGYVLYIPAVGLMLFFVPENLPDIKIIAAGASVALSAISGLIIGASITLEAWLEIALEKIDWEDEG